MKLSLKGGVGRGSVGRTVGGVFSMRGRSSVNNMARQGLGSRALRMRAGLTGAARIRSLRGVLERAGRNVVLTRDRNTNR